MGSLLGRTLAGYAITSTLGKGGMGVVYRARQQSLGREVALKVISDEARELQTAVKRFHREVKIHLELAHPHLAQIYDAGIADEHAYIAMELIDGPPLSQVLQDRGPLPWVEVADMADGLLDALAYLHGRGVLHRDIKPANILVGKNGEAKIVDLGLARQEHGTLLTTDAEFFGTVLYSPPEIFTGDDHSPAGDVYAMGLVLLEMLIGKSVFPLRAIRETIEAILSQPILPPAKHGREDVPEALSDLLMEMVAMEATRRPGAAPALTRLRAIARPAPVRREAPATAAPARRSDPGTRPAPAPETAPDGVSLFMRTSAVLRSWIPLPAGQGILAAGFGASLALGVWFGLHSGAALETRPGSAPPEARTAPPAADQATLSWMREQLSKCEELLERHDREAPDPELHRHQSLIRSGILGDDFFRQDPGDVSHLFTAIARFLDLMRRGDEEHIDDPVWLDVERVGYRILMEAARSNAYDTGSHLRPPMQRYEKYVRESRSGRYRPLVSVAIPTQMDFFEGLADKDVLSRVSAHERLLEEMDKLPATWNETSRAKVLRLDALIRLCDVWVAAARNATPERAREVEAGRVAAQLATLDMLRAVPRGLAVDVDLADDWLWGRFIAVTTALPSVASGSDRLRDALRMLRDMAPHVDLLSLAPTTRIAVKRSLGLAVLEATKRPDIALEPALVEKYRKLEAALPAQ